MEVYLRPGWIFDMSSIFLECAPAKIEQLCMVQYRLMVRCRETEVLTNMCNMQHTGSQGSKAAL